MNTKKDIRSFDFILVILVFTLTIMGIIAIGSATHINLGEESRMYNMQKIWFLVGIILMLLAAFVDYEFLGRFYILMYIINIALLIAVLIVGRTTNGATRWINIGDNIAIQPSEFAKIIVIFVVAKVIDKKIEKINNIPTLFLITALGLLPTILISLQPSLSASLVLLSIFSVLLYVGGLSYKYIIIALLIFIPLSYIFITDIQKPEPVIISKILEDYQLLRIQALVLPSSDNDVWQTTQSIKAIGSGQLKGKGLYNSDLNQLSYLPESHNDFIFSVIGEEFGFIGCSVVLAIIFIIIFKCIWIAKNAVDTFGRLIAVGIAFMFTFQTFVNVGVASGMLPNTGMPLPFISYGGSSLWTNMIAIGLILNIKMKKQKPFFEGD